MAHIQEKIQESNRNRKKIAEIDSVKVLQVLTQQAFGDTRELSSVHIGSCRHCWGKNFQYQRTDGELQEEAEAYEEKCRMAKEAGKPALMSFRLKGGGGYSLKNPPNQDCPHCAGEGIARAVLKDFRNLKDGTETLFVSARQAKDGGVDIKLVDRQLAHTNLMRHLGLFEADNKQARPEDVTPETFAKIAAAMQIAQARHREVIAGRRGRGFPGD